MDDEVKGMSDKQLASCLRGLASDYMEGYTGQAVEYERDLMREAARRVAEARDEARDEASEDKQRYTCVMMGGGALLWLEGGIEEFMNEFQEAINYDEGTLISGIDQDGRQTYVVVSKIEAIYDFGTGKPKRFDW